MSVENSKVIDFISDKEDKIVLTISDHLEWDNDNEHIYLLQEKINAYLMAIESGQINKSYPLSINKKIVVSVALKYVPNEIGMSFLSKVNEVLLNAGYEFNYHILAEEYNLDPELPLIKLRLSNNYWGWHYIRMGDFARAEKSFYEALDAESPDSTKQVLTDFQIKQNLLIAYYSGGNAEKAIDILKELIDMVESDPEHSVMTKEDEFRLYLSANSIRMQFMRELEQEEAEDLIAILYDIYDDLLDEETDVSEYSQVLAVYVFSSIILLYSEGYLLEEDYKLFWDMIEMMKEDKQKIPLDYMQQLYMYVVLTILATELGRPESDMYISKVVELLGVTMTNFTINSSLYVIVCSALSKNGKIDESIKYLDASLQQINETWHYYVRYINDHRLTQVLHPAQYIFNACYRMLRNYSEPYEAYERILQYKALASLASHERNRIIHGSQVDQKLLRNIQMAQEKLAALEADGIFRDTTQDSLDMERLLRNLEAEFIQQFPQKASFKEITIEKVYEAIPDDSVVVEYYLSAPNGEEAEELLIEIYIIKKTKGKVSLEKLIIENGLQTAVIGEEFVKILQNESMDEISISDAEKKEPHRTALYDALVKPILPFIEGFDTVYIAPDILLINVPLEILYDEEEISLEEEHTIIKIECARDFLFMDDKDMVASGSLIMGNPKYEMGKVTYGNTPVESDVNLNRFTKLHVDTICQLPFSELEAERISRRCKEDYYIGDDAVKDVLPAVGKVKNIHIATHGYFDMSAETDSMYSSCLLFAGVKNWLRTGRVSRFFGNGIITADEISRMDLQGTELVVLSSCLSGMNERVVNKGLQGMLGAFASAGVKYIVAHLWSADDFSTAVFMDIFYYYYETLGQEPPIALRNAKLGLQKVTIGQLREQGWFDAIHKLEPLDEKNKKRIEEIETLKDRICPFRDETYWGGFSCYRCN